MVLLVKKARWYVPLAGGRKESVARFPAKKEDETVTS